MTVPSIHSVRIEGFRRLEEVQEFDLRTPRGEAAKTMVLAGPNGSGKTSVLDAILLGLGRDDLITRDFPKEGRKTHWKATVPVGARIELEVSLDGATEPSKWIRTSQGLTTSGVDAAGKPLKLDKVAPGLQVEYFSSWRAPALVGAVKTINPRQRPDDAEAHRLWRLKQKIIEEMSRRTFGGTPSAGATDRASNWLKRLNGAWRRFHGDDGTTIEVQLERPDGEDVRADLYVVRDGRRVCSIDQVSSGEIEILSMAGWMVLNDFAAGVVLIDEPELHLHPQWQSAFLPAMRELAPEAQFIVASHSAATWDQVMSYQRFLLVADSDPRSAKWRKEHVPENEER